MTPSFILTLSCRDTAGIVHAVSGFLAEEQCTIDEAQQFGDPKTGTFFMRVRFAPLDGARASGDVDAVLAALSAGFGAVAERFAMSWRLVDAHRNQRMLVLVSTAGHCLNDLLYRCSIGALPVNPVGVVSNHTTLEPLARHHAVPYTYIPVTRQRKDAAEAALLRLVAELDVDFVVLARYMQVLSDQLCDTLQGRVINIHHSLLPSFKGARPYHQAYERGVKRIGATAHYVTPDLDEGPIIEQEVARIDHTMTAEDVVAAGRDVECQALARAVLWHAEARVLLNGTRTVVLR